MVGVQADELMYGSNDLLVFAPHALAVKEESEGFVITVPDRVSTLPPRQAQE